MAQAIITKFIGPTETRGHRIKASCESGSVTIAYPDCDDNQDAHHKAAQALCNKFGWSGRLIGGALPSCAGYAFVFEPVATGRVRDALGNLLQWAVGNRGDKAGNPYGSSKPEVLEGLQSLYYERTGNNGEFSQYCDAAEPWKKK